MKTNTTLSSSRGCEAFSRGDPGSFLIAAPSKKRWARNDGARIFLFFLLLMLPITLTAAPIQVNAIHVQEEKDRTHVSFNLTQPVKWNTFSLAHPNRIIIDFENTRLSLNLQKNPLLKKSYCEYTRWLS
jgi:hypothetical protein